MAKLWIARAACAATAWFGMTAIAADDAEPRTISVTGVGEIAAAPDVAEINAGVTTRAETASAALDANSRAMNAIFENLKSRGVAAKDIQTTQLRVDPEYSQPQPRQPRPGDAAEFVPRLIGYRVSNQVQVTSRQIPKLGELLDALVQSGANQINGIAFRVNEPAKLLDEARKKAVADARRKAQMLADESGVVLGPPRTIRETGGMTLPPRPRRGNMMMAMGADAREAPIAGGEQELTVTVDVIYEIGQTK